jgi:hypothetical protein
VDDSKAHLTESIGETAHPTTQSAVASPAAPELANLLTHEDVDRARDRWEVAGASKKLRMFGCFGCWSDRECWFSWAKTMLPACFLIPRTVPASV